ncbi:MAG: hypothetical protein ABIR28_11655, partial [Vicinamibacteria bacterium]
SGGGGLGEGEENGGGFLIHGVLLFEGVDAWVSMTRRATLLNSCRWSRAGRPDGRRFETMGFGRGGLRRV